MIGKDGRRFFYKGQGMARISVIIPTFRRPEGVRRAVESALAQTGAPDFEVVVVDNAPEGGAAPALSGFDDTRLRLVSEPHPGVATARNAGWAAASAPVIAFLDDDETAGPGWLAALYDALTALDASVVFGPIKTVLPDTAPAAHRDFLDGFFARTGPESDGRLEDYFGCGNSMIDRERLALSAPPFDTQADQLGGEDDLLFASLKRRDAVFGWAAGALAYEHVPETRATLRYALARGFAYGQGPSQSCASASPPEVLRLAGWMAVGAAQAVVYGVASGALWLARSERRAAMLDRCVQGLGKVFWGDTFAPRLYGGG